MFVFLGTVPDTPSGEGFPRQVRLCPGSASSEAEKRQKEKQKKKKKEEERKREKKERRGLAVGIVGPSRSESHTFRQSSVRREAYKR